MDLFDFLALIGGLALFLFGMNLMGTGLEKSAGNKLKRILETLTSKKENGLLMGMGVTAIIQSSSATTVMVVGFVNSGIMSLKQAIHVIMGANVGTTVTAWILSLTGIQGDNFFIQLLKPTSFTPVLALIGVILFIFIKNQKKKDIGLILMGFAVLMFGMEAMSAAVQPLAQVEGFRNIMVLFSNPLLGVLLGAFVTGVIQSSSASVGILQALSATGQITMGAAIPIIMGQNIGTTVTALLSSIGTNKNARRAAIVHLYFNLIGTAIFVALFVLSGKLFDIVFYGQVANPVLIAIAHSVFNILCTSILLPFSGWLEKLAYKTIKDDDKQDKISLLDSRLFSTPSIAINRAREVTEDMADTALSAIRQSIKLLGRYDEKAAEKTRAAEEQTDVYEDALGSYLVKLSSQSLSAQDATESAKLLYLIGEFERIADYALEIAGSAEEMHDKKLHFSDEAAKELEVMCAAVDEIVEITVRAFKEDNFELAARVDPLEEVIDELKSTMKRHHVSRLQCNACTIEQGFIFSDLITAMERVSDHCSNVAGGIIEISHDSLNTHNYLYKLKTESEDFRNQFQEYSLKYKIKE